MNLNSLKPAWSRFRLLNSMQACDQNELLLIIGSAEAVVASKTYRYVVGGAMFIVITLCCQGG
jgi:hypothetical protein